MHGAQSREGSGGESSGDEADLDRFEHRADDDKALKPSW